MAIQQSAPLPVNVFDLKEIASRLQSRASEINVHLPLSASLELASSVFGYNNFHEVSPILKGKASLRLAGVDVSCQMIQSVFECFERETGLNEVGLAVRAPDPGGDFGWQVIVLNASSFSWMLENLLVMTSRHNEPVVRCESYSWSSEIHTMFDPGDWESSYFYASSRHKHSEAGDETVSDPISPKVLFASVLFKLASLYAPKWLVGLDAKLLSQSLDGACNILYALDGSQAVDILVNSGDFEFDSTAQDHLQYGSTLSLNLKSLFVMLR